MLNVRSGPGTHNPQVGTYKRGEQVKITLQQKVGNVMWGKTDKGWISLFYVDLTPVKNETPEEPTEPVLPTEPAPTEPVSEEPAE